MALLTRSFDAVRSYLGSVTWGPLLTLSRRTITGVLQGIEVGQLKIVDVDGTVTRCGREVDAGNSGPKATLKIQREAFWPRLLLFADMVGDDPRESE